MDNFLSKDVLVGLEQARTRDLKRTDRLRVVVGEQTYPVIRSWVGGFAVDAESTPHLRGTIDFCNGTNVLFECLIVCSAKNGREMVYEFKRKTPLKDKAPLDFVRKTEAPVALLSK